MSVWPLVGAVVSLFAALWNGARPPMTASVVALAAMALSLFLDLHPVFLYVFLTPTLVYGAWSLTRGTRSVILPVLGSSDLLLALAFTQLHASTGGWLVPQQWESGAVLVGLAAGLRAVAAVMVEDERSISVRLIHLWQALALFVWVGSEAAGAALASAGVLLLLVAFRRPVVMGLAVGAASAAAVAASGSHHTALLASVCLMAGVAWWLGERALSLLGMIVIPSLLPGPHGVGVAVGVAAAILVAPAVFWLGSDRPASGGRGTALLSAGGALVTAPGAGWLMVLVALGGGYARLSSKGDPQPVGRAFYAPLPWSDPTPAAPRGQSLPVFTAGWVVLVLAIAVWLRLLLTGLSTSFI